MKRKGGGSSPFSVGNQRASLIFGIMKGVTRNDNKGEDHDI